MTTSQAPQRAAVMRAFAYLGTSGALTALVLLALATQQVPGLRGPAVIDVLLLLQLHVAGVTLLKFGLDTSVFALASSSPDYALNEIDVVRFPVAPMWLLYSAIAFAVTEPVSALALSIAALADALAMFHLAYLNGMRRYGTVALAGVMNYPLFVGTWALVAHAAGAVLRDGLLLFALSTLLRLWWLRYHSGQTTRSVRRGRLVRKSLFGVQGLLNLAMFRLDQLLLANGALTRGAPIWQSVADQYVLAARIPDIATGFVVLFGSVVFPRASLDGPLRTRAQLHRLIPYLIVGLILFAVSWLTTYAVLVAFFDRPGVALFSLPFALQIGLALPVNLITYSMIRAGALHGLLAFLALAVLLGSILSGTLLAGDKFQFLPWVPVCQLGIFVGAGLLLNWGPRSNLHQQHAV